MVMKRKGPPRIFKISLCLVFLTLTDLSVYAETFQVSNTQELRSALLTAGIWPWLQRGF